MRDSEPVIDEEHTARAVMFQLLSDDRTKWTIGGLKRLLSDLAPEDIDSVLLNLTVNGVIVVIGETLTTSSCVNFLEQLGLVSM